MKTCSRRIVSFTLAVLLTFGGILPVFAVSEPLINSTFEDGTEGWTDFNGNALNTVSVKNGRNCMEVSGTVKSAELTLQPNTTYRLSAWVRGNAKLSFDFGDGDSSFQKIGGSAETWTLLDMQYTTKASQTRGSICVEALEDAVYLDDVQLEEMSEPTNTVLISDDFESDAAILDPIGGALAERTDAVSAHPRHSWKITQGSPDSAVKYWAGNAYTLTEGNTYVLSAKIKGKAKLYLTNEAGEYIDGVAQAAPEWTEFRYTYTCPAGGQTVLVWIQPLDPVVYADDLKLHDMTSQEVIVDDDFETNAAILDPIGGAAAERTDAVSAHPQHSWKITQGTSDSAAKYWAGNAYTLTEGNTYVLSAKIKGKAKLYLTNEAGEYIDGVAQAAPEWTEFRYTYTCPAGGQTVLVWIQPLDPVIYADDLYFASDAPDKVPFAFADGFEDGIANWPAAGAVITMAPDGGSAALTVDGAANAKHEPVAVVAGSEYRASAEVYGSVQMLSACGGEYHYAGNAGQPDAWTSVSYEFTAGGDLADIEFVGTGLVDNVKLEKVADPVEPTDPVNPTDPVSPTDPVDPDDTVDPENPVEEVPGNLVENASFESGAADWVYFDQDRPAVTDDTENRHTGKTSMKLTKADGGAKYKAVTVEPGAEYALSAWVKGKAALQIFDGKDYVLIAEGGEDGKWTKLEGSHTFGTGSTSAVLLFTPVSDAVYIDDVVFRLSEGGDTEPDPVPVDPENLILNASFEKHIHNWVYFANPADGKAVQTDTCAHQGGYAMQLTKDNVGVKHVPEIQVEEGAAYQVDAWVYGKVTMVAGGNYLVTEGGRDGEWTKISGEFVAGAATADIQFVANSTTVYLDDVLFKKTADPAPVDPQPADPEKPVTPAAGNLIQNASFESGAADWVYFDRDRPAVTDNAENRHTGKASLKLTKADGGVKYKSVAVEPGATYELSAWVKGKATLQIFDGKDYPFIVEGGKEGQWTKLKGSYTFGAGQTEAVVLLTPVSGTIYIDDVVLKKTAKSVPTAPLEPVPADSDNLLPNPDFESETGDWATLNDTPMRYSRTQFHGGSQSVCVPAGNGIKQLRKSTIVPGQTYELSAWVYGKVNVIGLIYSGADKPIDYYNGGEPITSGGEEGKWTLIQGTFMIDDANAAYLSVEFRSAGKENYVDDIWLRAVDGELPGETLGSTFANLGFEEDGGWVTFDESPLAYSTEYVHEGLRAVAFTTDQKGVKTVAQIQLEAGRSYEISAWVYGQVQMLSAIYGADGKPLGDYLEHASSAEGGTWVKLTGRIENVGEGGLIIDLEFLNADPNGGNVFVDDIEFRDCTNDEPDVTESPTEAIPVTEPKAAEESDKNGEKFDVLTLVLVLMLSAAAVAVIGAGVLLFRFKKTH